jgi:hypothetical protein
MRMSNPLRCDLCVEICEVWRSCVRLSSERRNSRFEVVSLLAVGFLAEVWLHDPVDHAPDDGFVRLCERGGSRMEKEREREAEASRVANHGTPS